MFFTDQIHNVLLKNKNLRIEPEIPARSLLSLSKFFQINLTKLVSHCSSDVPMKEMRNTKEMYEKVLSRKGNVIGVGSGYVMGRSKDKEILFLQGFRYPLFFWTHTKQEKWHDKRTRFNYIRIEY